jgi:hypothetical protein
MSLMLQHVYPDDHLVGTGTDHPLREPLHRVHLFTPVRQKKGDAFQLGPQDFADYSVAAVKWPLQRLTAPSQPQPHNSRQSLTDSWVEVLCAP